uniref:ABC transporter substrate-binding protein n=1 Tax=Pararhizobium sp. IMCC3301 TaxID=3067904 RepID=UPI0027422E17|nr:ABC transporter substrate-binding protein [Pararhizobium sp. IMCC3301]
MTNYFLKRGLSAVALGFVLATGAMAQSVVNVGAFGADANQLDPHLSGGGQDRALFGYVFNGLTRFPPGSMDPTKIELDLASSIDGSDDGLVWTIKLRDDVPFHHGYGQMNSADVVYSLDRARNPETSGFASALAAIESVEAVDDTTVTITLKERVPTFEGMLANPAGGYIISQKAAEELGDDVKAAMVGTGPFQFETYTPKVQTVLSAHTGYFRGAPKLEQINYRYIPSDNARELAFAAGEIDLFYGRREQDWVERVKNQYGDDLDVLIFSPSQSRMLHLNKSVPPLDDIRVRQAIAHAINRDEFQVLIGQDITKQLFAPVPSGFLGQASDLPRYEFDQEKSKALLAEAGYPDGVSIKVPTTQIASLKVPFELIMEQLRRVGINLEVDFVDHRAWHALIRKDESPLVIYGAAPFPESDAFLTPFFASSSIVGTPTGQTNFSHCDVADEEIAAARIASDAAMQLASWEKAQQKIMEDLCVVPIFELMQVWGKRKSLELGYELTGTLNLGPPITEATHFAQ